MEVLLYFQNSGDYRKVDSRSTLRRGTIRNAMARESLGTTLWSLMDSLGAVRCARNVEIGPLHYAQREKKKASHVAPRIHEYVLLYRFGKITYLLLAKKDVSSLLRRHVLYSLNSNVYFR